MSSSTTKTIVVFGSTGVQGTSFIKAMSGTPGWQVLALSRNPNSASAQRLAKLPGVKVVKVADDCMDEPEKVFSSLGLKKRDVHGVLSIQGYVDDKAMYKQGAAIADAAKEFGVKHLVYSSADFGGLDDCGIKSFEVKRQVENHIKTLGIGYTFLRPVQFMENWLPDAPTFLRAGRTVTRKYTFYKHPERKHQLVSSRDIGKAAAKAFVEGPNWNGGVIRLAGDGLTMDELDQAFKDVLGEPVKLLFPSQAAYVAKLLVPIVKEAAKFWDEHGYNVDIAQVKQEFPDVEDVRTFLARWKAEQKQ